MKQHEIHPIIKQIVDRCHTGYRRTEVVRCVMSGLAQGKIAFKVMSRNDRKYFIRQCLERHEYNRRLYSESMENRHHR